MKPIGFYNIFTNWATQPTSTFNEERDRQTIMASRPMYTFRKQSGPGLIAPARADVAKRIFFVLMIPPGDSFND